MTSPPEAPSDPPVYTDGRLSAPAALRNRDALTRALTTLAPTTGRALEIASGTGEHAIHFARALPGLTWQPSDPDATRRASIAAWSDLAPSPNLLPPIDLDACVAGWADTHADQTFVFVANLLHLVPAPMAQICLTEMAATLAPGGLAAVYGPFLRDGKTTSDGDAAFHARLAQETPGAGYKDLAWVHGTWRNAGLVPQQPATMPANNLILTARKPATAFIA